MDLAADFGLAAFKTGMDFWARWPFLLLPGETEVQEIARKPASEEAIHSVAKTIAPPPTAPVIVTPAVAPVPKASSNWKPKEPKKKTTRKSSKKSG